MRSLFKKINRYNKRIKLLKSEIQSMESLPYYNTRPSEKETDIAEHLKKIASVRTKLDIALQNLKVIIDKHLSE